MVTSNRSISTGHNPEQGKIVLEVTRDGKFSGKAMKKGETIACTKSEARRLLATDKTMFKILLD